MATFGNLTCILAKATASNMCSGLKPFQTGTPFCGAHLREIFGLQTTYFGPKKHGTNQSITYGPFLQVAPDVTFDVGTYIFPSREMLDSARQYVQSDENINPVLLDYIETNKLLRSGTNGSTGQEALAVLDYLRNWQEEDTTKLDNTSHPTWTCIKEKKEEFIKACSSTKIISKALEDIEIPDWAEVPVEEADEPGPVQPLSKVPYLLGFCGIHIAPALYCYKTGYLPQTVISNVAYINKKGYITLKKLEHLDILIQTGQIKDPSSLSQILHHQRQRTTTDNTFFSSEYITNLGRQAYPRAFTSYDIINMVGSNRLCDHV